jgi:hypothetical protein
MKPANDRIELLLGILAVVVVVVATADGALAQGACSRAGTHKSRLFGNRWLPQTTRESCAGMFRQSSAGVATSRAGHHLPL